MRRLISDICLFVLLPLWLLVGASQAQFNNFPLGTFNSRAALDGGGGAPFQGAGDAVSGAFAYWGLRCYTTAYTGNVADVYAPTDASHTLITCSAGGILNETLQALSVTCGTPPCTIKTFYDQSGNTNCTTACDMTQAVIANRAAFTLNCSGTKYCATGAVNVKYATPALVAPLIEPMTITTAAKRTSGTSYSTILSDAAGGFGLYYGNTANKADVFAGTDHLFNQTDGSCQRVIGVYNTASSSGTTNGSTTALSIPAGAGFGAAVMRSFDDSGGDYFIGPLFEIGLWASAFSGPNISAMDTNISLYGAC